MFLVPLTLGGLLRKLRHDSVRKDYDSWLKYLPGQMKNLAKQGNKGIYIPSNIKMNEYFIKEFPKWCEDKGLILGKDSNFGMYVNWEQGD